MKKLGIVCALLLTFGTPLANSATIPPKVAFPISNITVGPGDTLGIPLNELIADQPYLIGCYIADPNYLQNQVSIAPSFTGQMGPPFTVAILVLNGTFFTNEASCSKTAEVNELEVWVSPATPASNTVTIGNLDKTDSIVVQSCFAVPFTH